MNGFIWFLILVFVLFIGYFIMKTVQQKRTKVRNVAADYGSAFGPWGAMVSGIAKAKGYGSENVKAGVQPTSPGISGRIFS